MSTKNPAAVVAVAQQALSFYSSSQDARERRAMVALLRQIDRKVDVVISLQREILDELRELRIQFRADLRNEFLFALQSELSSISSRISMVAALEGQVPDRRLLPDAAGLVPDAEDLSFRLLHYGPAAFPAAVASIAAFSSLLALMRMLGANRRDINAREKENIIRWIEIVSSWSSEDSSWSLSTGVATMRAEIDQLTRDLETAARRVDLGWRFIGYRDHPNHERMVCKTWQRQTLIIDGDIETGFTDRIEDGEFRRRECFIRRDPHELAKPVGDEAPAAILAGEIDYDQYDPEKPFEIGFLQPATEPSGWEVWGVHPSEEPVNSSKHAITDGLNALRDQRSIRLTQMAALVQFIGIVASLTTSLRSRASGL